eukprot:TRINITY_DN10848_c0_g1_i1.p1 TRINITY_DN10848_c0_g1~~TRINITY_DN10848_c0_g1_i1.p1  ORF type:complete len:499 (+),score=138.45 TRINITY_DN10848_c0_g1_i1:62-1558(+)
MPANAGASFHPSELPPGAWGAGPSAVVKIDELVLNRYPGESGLGLGLVGLQLQGVGAGSAAERCGAARFIGRNLRTVNGREVTLLKEVAEAAGPHGPVVLGFESRGDRDQRRRLSKARRMLSAYEDESTRHTESDLIRLLHDDVWTVRRHDPRLPLGLDLREPGLTIEQVRKGSPADQAGLARCIGKAVLRVQGHRVNTTADFASLVSGQTSVELSLSEEVAGCLLRRGTPAVPLGFAVSGPYQELVRVDNGSPAHAAGMQDFVGTSVTHVDGQVIQTAEDIARACRGKLQMFLRFGPLPDWDEDDEEEEAAAGKTFHETGGVREVELDISDKDSKGLGMQLRAMAWVDPEDPDEQEERYLVLSAVLEDTPAQFGGLQSMVGQRLSHVDGIPVSSPQEVVAIAGAKSTVRLRFRPQPAPSEFRAEPDDVSAYREWMQRRQELKGRAERPCERVAPAIRLMPAETKVVLGPRAAPGDMRVTGGLTGYVPPGSPDAMVKF